MQTASAIALTKQAQAMCQARDQFAKGIRQKSMDEQWSVTVEVEWSVPLAVRILKLDEEFKVRAYCALLSYRAHFAMFTSILRVSIGNFTFPIAPIQGKTGVVRRSHSCVSKGFTLLELLVVMVIIGLLASYVGPRYFAQLGKSEQGVAKAQIEALAKALDAYRLDVGSYPANDIGLEALTNKGSASDKWRGPYLQKAVPVDPWGRPYLYKSNNDSDFELQSLGKDGQPCGTQDNADVNFR